MTTLKYVFSGLRNILALALGALIFYGIHIWASGPAVGMKGLAALVFYLFSGAIIPSFLACFLALILPGWRHKLSAGIFLLFGITIYILIRLFLVSVDWFSFIYSVVLLSGCMAGVLAALSLWRRWRTAYIEKKQPGRSVATDSRTLPWTLLVLSLFSVPLTYLTLITGSLMTLGFSAALLFLLFMLPRIPVVLLAAGFLAPLAALWTTIQALAAMLSGKAERQFAVVLEADKHPELVKLIQNVCTELGARFPDNIILLAEPNFFVTTARLQCYDREIKGRTLALGLPLVKEITAEELKGILAHEFAHFTGNDTLYSKLVAPVYKGLGTSFAKLQQAMNGRGGTAGAVMNLLSMPTLIFLRIFYEFFASMTMGLSRSRELRADWLAAGHYGKRSLISGLEKTNKIVPHFYEFIQKADLQESDAKGLFTRHSQLLQEDSSQLNRFLDKALEEEEKEFSSHPTLKTRIRQLEGREEPSLLREMEKDFALQDAEERLSFFYSKTIMQSRQFLKQVREQQPAG